MGSIDSDFAYDDAFKTMVVESDELVLPLLNEMFGEHYRGDERIIRYGNEHYIEQGIAARMEETVERGDLEEFSETVIKEMSNRVANKLARKYGNVRKGIGDLMGGKVLETEAVRIKREGKMEGRREGEREGKKEIIEIMLRKGQSPEQVADLTELPIDFVRSVEQSILQMA